MPRQKQSRVARTYVPGRLQDQSAFARRLVELLGDEITDDLDERITDVETVIASIDRGDFSSMVVDLRPGGYGGTIVVEPEDGFTDEAVGRPVMVTQGPSDDDEACIVAFTGRVLNRQQLEVRWNTRTPAPARVTILFIVT